MQSDTMEATKDILVAYISKVGTTTPSAVADAYRTIYEAVANPTKKS